ncbi:EAL domain-containing protein [Micromonospora sp. STR1s_5]|nr:EAL domain-containing protein [Micromonospora sp. STR1s_5]
MRSLPADVVKIDQSLIRELAACERAQTLDRSMIALARSLDFEVVAEGVEDQDNHGLLRAFSCEEAQVYLISRPLAAVEFSAWYGPGAERTVARPQGCRRSGLEAGSLVDQEEEEGSAAASARSAASRTSSPRQGFRRARTPSGKNSSASGAGAEVVITTWTCGQSVVAERARSRPSRGPASSSSAKTKATRSPLALQNGERRLCARAFHDRELGFLEQGRGERTGVIIALRDDRNRLRAPRLAFVPIGKALYQGRQPLRHPTLEKVLVEFL